ncbi:putative Transcriptional regulator, LysR family [Vibrio nigripulchritudo MADA3029]|nr:putative Transcriptional regulator, LysR family [Vibrio nigripulchritudo MADA3020]CCN51749.1 putative Transcriptional regulator, LysR family [Vibrio nigripulchritudo MADA3021]CCN61913.1 putative Transcriptional regulator, LysR family [Vibrio nigripulchritudo MADA3029]
MENMKRYCIFSVVASAGSMTAASKRLGMSPSAISQNISQLENALGVTLLHRSTRGLSVSEAGQILLQGYGQMRSHFESLEQKLSDCREGVRGEVRISCSAGMAQEVIANALSSCLSAYPELRVTLITGEEARDIVQENIDIAITLGDAKDSNLVYRPLGEMPRVVCASSHYIDTYGTPDSIDDIINHHWIINSDCCAQKTICSVANIEDKRDLNVRFKVNNDLVARAFAITGQGLALIPQEFVREHLNLGDLCEVLSSVKWPNIKVQALTVSRSVPKKVEVVLEALKAFFHSEGKKAKALH